jgi:hypothetical protein
VLNLPEVFFSSAAWTALATIAIAAFTYSLRRSTAKQWKVANRNLIESHRPWLKIDVVGGELHYFDGPGLVLTLKLRVKNIGKSPAKRVRLELGKPVESDARAEQRAFIESMRTNKNEKGAFLFPDESITEPMMTTIMPGEEVARLEAPRPVGGIYVVAYDSDISEATHITSFIVSVTLKNGNLKTGDFQRWDFDDLRIERRFPYNIAD